MKDSLRLGCLLTVFAALAKSIAINQVAEQHSTIVEKNHFYSNYEINTTYEITGVDNKKPIILYLKKKDENSVFDNNITIELVSGDASSNCLFDSFDKMCFLDHLPTASMKLKIRCEHLPCELSWTILQPAMKKAQEKQQATDLFDISESNSHLIAVVTCNNPEIKDFNRKVQAYSENDYIRGFTDGIIYYLFSKEKEGHIYFRIEESAQSCAEMGVYNVKQMIVEGELTKDFILSSKQSEFKFVNRPSKQFRFDISMHELEREPIATALDVQIVGQKNGGEEIIKSLSIKPGFGTTVYDYTLVVPEIDAAYTDLRIRFKSNNKIIMLNFELHEGVAEIEEAEHSHFALKTDEKISYRIMPKASAGTDEVVKVFLAHSKKVRLSKQQCSKRDGCEFQVTALEDTESLLYIGNQDKSEASKNEIVFAEFTDRLTRKIHESDVIYLKKEVIKDKYFQVVVNNPNVILYAASQEKCPKPSPKCYEKIANIHNPFVYGPPKNGNLLIAVKGLENCEFTITAIPEGDSAINLYNNEPFAYLMDDKETSLIFKFSNPDKEGISFNLIAPLNDMVLVVRQGSENPDPDEDTNSLDGFVSFAKSEVNDREFRILVKKTEDSAQKFVHFTLIATINGTNLRLDSGVPHYETLKPKEHRDFVFEFDKSQDYLVNFYTYNIDNKDIKIPMMVSSEDEWTSKKVKHFEIENDSDALNLKDISEQLCHKEGEVTCEIFIRLTNTMSVQIDMTITLMVKDSVIELKDGLWQSFTLNEIAETAHFFFLPKNKEKSININYRSNIVNFGMVYTLWKSDEKTISPEEWPFPAFKEVDQEIDKYKAINHVVIDHESLKQCWPSCIVLVSLYKKKSAYPLKADEATSSFSVMASNSMYELPEKTKLDVYLKKDEEKYIMVDLKYALEKEALTFFHTSVLGYTTMSANVYSEKNQRCPEDFEADFSFGTIETIIKVDSIKKKISENNMDEDENLYLCILTKAFMESKFNLEYSTEDELIKVLKLDTFETVSLEPKVVKMFQLEAWQFYEIKFTREKGYFYVKVVVCDSIKDGGYEGCLEDLQSGQDRGKKIVTKTEQFSQQPCPKCIVYVRLESEESSEVIIHVQSQYSSIELKENDIISDFTNEEEENKYALTSVQYEETIINIEVTEGEPVVIVTDYGKLNIQREKNSETNNIHIVIPPVQGSNDHKWVAPSLGGANYYGFGYSKTFRFLGIKIKSKNPKLPCSYTISYSSGERETYLEDGLLVGYTLEPSIKTTFFYKNPYPNEEDKKGYITISMKKSSTLFNLDLKMFTFTDVYDEDTKKEVSLTKPPMRKKTPNPTMTFSLPTAPLMSLEMESAEEAKVTIIVNHQEVVIVSFNEEFPFQLMTNQKINLISDISNPGYISISIRKCDQSQPTFSYSFDPESFQKSEFENSVSLEDDPRFQFYLKASKIGTLFMQLSNNDVASGLFAITVKYSDSKIATSKMKSGNNGIVDYSIIDSSRALVKFSAAVCPKGRCSQGVKYFWVAGKSLQDVYTQSVCPYTYFLLLDVVSIQPLTFTEIKTTKNGGGEISFEYPITEHVSYLAIKGIAGDEEIYYRPIEVVTMWGSITKSSLLHKLMVGILGVLVLCCMLVLCRRFLFNSDYKKIPEYHDYS